MAFFVGGQLFLALAVVPVERRNPDCERLLAIARRFGWGSLVAIGILLATGAAMATHDHRWENGTLHVKLTLVQLTAGPVAWHIPRPQNPAVEAAILILPPAI